MPSLKFPYLRFRTNPSRDPLRRQSFQRPVIPLRLFGPTGYIDTHALVDSGSDGTVFDHELAEAVGIDWKKGAFHEVLSVDGSRLPVQVSSVSYELEGHGFLIDAGFARLPYFKAVLGENGFFDRVIVSLDYGNNRVEVKI